MWSRRAARHFGTSRAAEEALTGLAFLSPNLIGFAVFFAFPLLFSLWVSFFDWKTTNTGKEFIGIHAEAERDLRELLAIPANYKVLFLQGGATLQFAQVPMNLLRGKGKADYVVTGEWSKKAVKEAKNYCDVAIAASSEDKNFTYAPKKWNLRKDAAYVHYCSNETIGGVEFHQTPDTELPLVADASSHFLSRPLDVSKFGLIYAGAQKNAGPAGLTFVIVREDLIGQAQKGTPTVMDYKLQADAGSMLNTPATYAMYIAGLVFKWLKALGGVHEIEKRNAQKARLLYDFLRSWRSSRQPSLVAAGLACTIAMVAAGMFEYNFHDSEFLMLFLVLITLPYAADSAAAVHVRQRVPVRAA